MTTTREQSPVRSPVRLITLDPGHFHAALVQKFMYDKVDPVVHVYAPGGDELDEHLKRIERFNTRPDQPTHWREVVHTGADFLETMLSARPGNVVVVAGNNARKTEYILRSVEAGLHVLADKPMAITGPDLVRLRRAFEVAAARGVLIYDIMTERHEITTILQRELSMQPALFGRLVTGTPEDPALTKASVHHFSKTVAGVPLRRPPWFFDVRQEGDGFADVMTHLVDLVQWEAFPGESLLPKDVTVMGARRWPTPMTQGQFRQVTGLGEIPDYLAGEVRDGVLGVEANAEITYRLRDVHARVSVAWDFEAPPGGGDTHFSVMRGTRANLVIRQGPAQNFQPVLEVANTGHATPEAFAAAVGSALRVIQADYPGVEVELAGDVWRVMVPEQYHVGHEAHFAQVTRNFLEYLRAGRLPAWEEPNMMAKYETIMQAREWYRQNGKPTR